MKFKEFLKINSVKYSSRNIFKSYHLEPENIVCRYEKILYLDNLFDHFVYQIITSDNQHFGFIRSRIRGTKNPNIIIYNIGGKYRFCELIQRHHKNNSIAILINEQTKLYALRCKDVYCDNSRLRWKNIQDEFDILHYSRFVSEIKD